MFIYPVLILGASGMIALISVLGIIGYLGSQKMEIDYGSIGKNFLKHLKVYKETTTSNEGKVGKFYYLFILSFTVTVVSFIYILSFFIRIFSQ